MVKTFIFSFALLLISDLANCQNTKTNNNTKNVDSFPNQNHSDSAISSRNFLRVQYAAEFPGGSSAFAKYLQKNLDPSIPKRNGAPAGRYSVIVKFSKTLGFVKCQTRKRLSGTADKGFNCSFKSLMFKCRFPSHFAVYLDPFRW